SISRVTHIAPFVGRTAEIVALERAFLDARERGAVTVFVHGESGIGKSELVNRFVTSIQERDPEAIVLEGRCYENEAVPYKAIDGVADGLTRAMTRMSAVEAAELVP